MNEQNSSTPKVAVVIPTYLNTDGLRKCLESIAKHTSPERASLVIVANGGPLGTVGEVVGGSLWNWGGEFEVCWHDRPLGFARACNVGVQKARELGYPEYVVLLNDDCVLLNQPKDQWLDLLLAPMSDPQMGITGVQKLLDESCNREFLIFFCAMLRMKTWEDIGGLDESLGSFGEDITACIEAERRGWKWQQVDTKESCLEGHQWTNSFPIYHEAEATVHQLDGWESHVLRNREIIKERYGKLKVLVVVANYGPSPHLDRMRREFDSFAKYDVHVLPIGQAIDPHQIPWLCRRKLFENCHAYDLYLYTENDILYSEENFDTFLELTKVLPDDKIAGFMRWENSPEGRFYPDWHGDFDWVAGSSFSLGEYQFAEFSNLHQAGFLCTRKQLNHAIDIAGYGPFLVPNKRRSPSRYDILARACTDFYDTGFTKVLSISHFEKMLVHHMSDKYCGVYGTKVEKDMQVALRQLTEPARPKYSIIVPTYGHLTDCLIPCLESIVKWTDLSNVEVIIVANGCGRDTWEYLSRTKETYNVVWFDDPIGFTRATNAGIDAARGDYLIFLNNDCEILSPYWISMLQQLWDATPNPAVVGPSIENAYNGQFCAFYCAMTSRAVIDQIGKLDEAFESGGEDIDFCRRAQRAGFQIRGGESVYDEQGERKYGIHFPVIHQGEVTVHEDPQFEAKRERSHALLRARYPRYSIIVPTFNHLDLLKRCLTSIIAHTDLSKCEVLVCANGCTEDTKDYVLSLGEPFILLWAEEQIGFTKATNIGIREAKGEYLVFLNNDTELQDNQWHKASEWLELLEEPFRNSIHTGMSGPLVFKGEGEGVSYDFVMMFAAMTSRQVIADVGELDEAFAPAGVEDIDFGIRLQEKGYDLVQVPLNADVAWNPNTSHGAFPIYHQGNASYGEIGNWHEILKRNEQLLKQKWPEKFRGLGWLDSVDWPVRHKWMKETDQQVYHELFEVNVYRCLREEIEGKTVIDIGANKGFFALKAIEMGATRVICYEPVGSIYLQLAEIAKDFPQQAIAIRAAVSDNSRLLVQMHEDSWCSHVWGVDGPEVPCLTLDDLLVGCEADPVLKCDCEGSEYEIFYGSTKEAIRRFETIYLEIHETPNPNYQYKGKELLAYLESLGYESHAGPQPGTWYGDHFVSSPISMYKLKRKPWVTVIIPTYQRHELLKEALESVRNQTYPFVTALVIADGHDEEAERIARQYGHTYTFIEHEGNIGTGCRIAGISLAHTEYVCFLDDDNLLEHQYAEKLITALTPDHQVAICQVQMHRWKDGNEVTRIIPADGPVPTWHEIDSLNFLVSTEIAKRCKDAWQQDPSQPVDQDYRFISECLKHTEYSYIEEVLGHHREVRELSNVATLAGIPACEPAGNPLSCRQCENPATFVAFGGDQSFIGCDLHKGELQKQASQHPDFNIAFDLNPNTETRPKPQVYDVFMYNGEDDVMEIRLHELDSVVDKFVVVEGNMTHSGLPKEYRFPWQRFVGWENKIICLGVDLTAIDFSKYFFDPSWVREHVQRDAARDLLRHDADYVIVGDVDEIPRASAVKQYIASDSDKVGVLVQDRFCYFLNYKCISTDEPQLNSKIFKYSMLGEFDLNAMRFSDQRNLMPTERIEDGGWHFTALGGTDKVKQKLAEFAHVEYQRKIGDVEKLIAEGEDFYDAETEYVYVPIDETFPEWVQSHVDELTEKGLIKQFQNLPQAKAPHQFSASWITPSFSTSGRISPKNMTVTVCVSTKDRYTTTLGLCLSAILNQTCKPDKLVIYDDSDPALDLRETPPFDGLLKLADDLHIKWQVFKTDHKKGQVENHRHCLETADTMFVWRTDDDEVPEPKCLETLLSEIVMYGIGGDIENIGAIGGLVHHPGNIQPLPSNLNGTLNDIALGLNVAWYSWQGAVREVEHLYSTFLYRVDAARKAGGYPVGLSPAGHREESWLTNKIHRAGYKVLITPNTRTWHLRQGQGGIRSYNDGSMWAHDEELWTNYLRTTGIDLRKTKLIICDMGLGDHLALRGVWDRIVAAHPDRHHTLSLCYPSVFEGVPNIDIISIADAKLIVGDDYNSYSLYLWCWTNNKQAQGQPLVESMVEFWTQ